MAIDLDSIAKIAEISAPFIAVVGFGWWLRDQFSKNSRNIFEFFNAKIDEHEKLDQSRHEDNLNEFRQIAVALAQMGYRRGNQKHGG